MTRINMHIFKMKLLFHVRLNAGCKIRCQQKDIFPLMKKNVKEGWLPYSNPT